MAGCILVDSDAGRGDLILKETVKAYKIRSVVEADLKEEVIDNLEAIFGKGNVVAQARAFYRYSEYIDDIERAVLPGVLDAINISVLINSNAIPPGELDDPESLQERVTVFLLDTLTPPHAAPMDPPTVSVSVHYAEFWEKER